MAEDITNTSGMGKEAFVLDIVAKRFNWGAFFFTWIWGIFNKSWLTFIFLGFQILQFMLGFLNSLIIEPNSSVTPIKIVLIIMFFIGLGLKIWLGINGNKWAWQNKRWESVERFHKIQKVWAIVGTVLFILSVLVTPIVIFLMYFVLYKMYMG